MTNVNPDTGVRYGTIYLNSLDGDTAQWLWGQVTNISEEEAYKELRAEIEAAIKNEILDAVEAGVESPYDDEDDIGYEVERRFERAVDSIQIEEPYLEGECEGVRYGISHLGGAALLWVFESPIISTARLCSPCVPNAGDLDSLDPSGYECYGIPDDWRAE